MHPLRLHLKCSEAALGTLIAVAVWVSVVAPVMYFVWIFFFSITLNIDFHTSLLNTYKCLQSMAADELLNC